MDRFHITTHLNQAVDQVRRGESSRLRAAGKVMAQQRLKHMRWPLLRRGSRVRGRARQKLHALFVSKLATARAWELKETFSHFWTYKSLIWAQAFLDYWCFRAMRSRLEPMKKVARMLRTYEELLLNWFRAKGEISAGPVEGLNNKIRVVTRRSYGISHLRSYGNRAISHARKTSLLRKGFLLCCTGQSTSRTGFGLWQLASRMAGCVLLPNPRAHLRSCTLRTT
jgi:transposase